MLKQILKFSQGKTGILLLLLIILAGVLKFQSSKYHNWSDTERLDRPIIRSDGSGYYAYLPQHFIYHDPDYFFIDSLLPNYPNAKFGEFGNYAHPDEGRMNKFFPGVAICQIPFFLTAHYFHSSKFNSDGYSYPYQRWIAIGAICFLLLGVFMSYLVMIRLKIAPLAAAISLIAVTLGTPLLFYTINEPLASHVYSFAIIALFIYLLLIWRDSRNSKWLPLIAMTLGLTLLLRPVNGIVVLLYFALFPSLKDAWSFLKVNLFNSLPRTALAILCFGSVVFIQYLNVYYQTGNLQFNLYSTETFENWNNPPFWKVLFGYRKGLFMYAPLTFFALLGYVFSMKKHRTESLVSLFFFLIFTYITAAWWCWWYGGSVGMRPMVDISLLFAVGIAIILHKGNWLVRAIVLPIITFCIYFQFILSHQFEFGILHYSEMSKERYDFIFLKTDRRLQWKYFIELPAQLEEPEKVSKTLLYDKNSNSFVESATVKNNTFQIEHMINQDLFKTVIDSSDFQNIKGISLEGKMTIRDKNNIPMVLVFLKKGDDWTQVQTDFVGMRIENINESSHFESDYVFPEDILSSDTLSIQFSNSHGLTTLENLKIQFVEK
jgi:hypothetical protein|tara:strand:- start:14625 stop:16433 length:1809 start_codon:yes stop_codon:yes gene_type:complete